MSFGTYRPTMGVAGGHRETCANHSLLENRRASERMARQENPITGEPMHSDSGRPPSGSLSVGLVPKKGPLDHMTLPDKDVPGKRVDPTKNHTASLGAGVACVPLTSEPTRTSSRLTEGCLGEGFSVREPTPERRRSPGQIVRSSSRPKDSLSGGACIASDRVDHPLNLPRKAGSAGAGVGSGGSVHLVAGPCGFVPAGSNVESQEEPSLPPRPEVPFRRAVGMGGPK